MTTATHIPIRGARRRLLLLFLLVVATAVLSPATAAAYRWPLEPFDVQHPVRGFFGDPRVGDGGRHSHALHMGIDISARNGTRVFATLTGRIVVEAERPHTVAVRNGGLVHSYWHVIPLVRDGDQAVAGRTVLGRVQAPWAHVHFGELRDGRYLNPLRLGGLRPYADRTRPDVRPLAFERGTSARGPVLRGDRLDLVAEVADAHPLRVPDRWRGKPVMPAIVRWRVVSDRRRGAWRTALDFTRPMLPRRFDDVYASGTRQNKPWRSGRYRVVLARGWSSSALAPGRYRLEVWAADTRANSCLRSVAFTVAS